MKQYQRLRGLKKPQLNEELKKEVERQRQMFSQASEVKQLEETEPKQNTTFPVPLRIFHKHAAIAFESGGVVVRQAGHF